MGCNENIPIVISRNTLVCEKQFWQQKVLPTVESPSFCNIGNDSYSSGAFRDLGPSRCAQFGIDDSTESRGGIPRVPRRERRQGQSQRSPQHCLGAWRTSFPGACGIGTIYDAASACVGSAVDARLIVSCLESAGTDPSSAVFWPQMATSPPHGIEEFRAPACNNGWGQHPRQPHGGRWPRGHANPVRPTVGWYGRGTAFTILSNLGATPRSAETLFLNGIVFRR